MPYRPAVRRFALVLSTKSKSAYTWLRNKFSKRLPALRTIRSWHKNSSANISSGFSNQSISILTNLANEAKAEGKDLYVSMSFDEVSIRKHIQWVHDEKYFSGTVTYGKRDDDEIPVANNAIFFLITLIQTGKTMVLGYFLIKTLNTQEKTKLVLDAIDKINSTGAYLISMAFDGLSTNFSVCESLGASFDIGNIRSFIKNPANGNKIYIVLDPPHMLKLIRNCLAAKSPLKDGKNNSIDWKFFERLVSVESSLVSHRMTRKHLDFHSNKMNVKLAAQTLSYSVARSMEVLLQNRNSNFLNAGGTITFIKNFNKAFDILNSKHIDSNNLFKRGLNEENAEKIFEFLNYFEIYIKSIKLGGRNILQTDRKTGFLGFLVNINTLKCIYEAFVLTKRIENIQFYFLGQDSLESLFSRIRSMFGNNTNPTAQQLMGALRQVLVLDEIKGPETANCEDQLDILTISSDPTQNQNNSSNISVNIQNFDEDVASIHNIELNFKDLYTIKLRAGTIERKIRLAIPRCKHEQCVNIFKNNCDKIQGIFHENGIAQRPTNSTVKICEIIYKFFIIRGDIYTFNYSQFYRHILDNIPFKDLYTHVNFSHNIKHKSEFILLIIDEYVRIHATYAARIATIGIHSKIIGKTSQKLKHFTGQ